MKRTLSIVLLAGTTGCAGMDHTERGALGGGLGGAGIGALIGAATGRPGAVAAGAAIGGATGAVTGAVVGSDADRREERLKARQAYEYASRNPPLSLGDIKQLSAQGTSPRIIVNQMDATNSYYRLTAHDIMDLRAHGVSDEVIAAMQSRSGPRVVAPVYVAQPPRPVYVLDPIAYPPPPTVGVGFSYSNMRLR